MVRRGLRGPRGLPETSHPTATEPDLRTGRVVLGDSFVGTRSSAKGGVLSRPLEPGGSDAGGYSTVSATVVAALVTMPSLAA